MCQSVRIIEKKREKKNEDKGPASMGQLKFTLNVDIFMYGKSDTKCESRELNTIEYVRYIILSIYGYK